MQSPWSPPFSLVKREIHRGDETLSSSLVSYQSALSHFVLRPSRELRNDSSWSNGGWCRLGHIPLYCRQLHVRARSLACSSHFGGSQLLDHVWSTVRIQTECEADVQYCRLYNFCLQYETRRLCLAHPLCRPVICPLGTAYPLDRHSRITLNPGPKGKKTRRHSSL